MKNTFIISLGGSLIVPKEGINWRLLKNFRKLILEQVKAGKRFFIITGGGMTTRNYNAAANKIVKVGNEDLDWLGIHATRLNAHLMRTIFYDVAHPEIIKNPTFRMPTDKKVIIAGGWKPGWSTDYVATMIAQEYEIKTVINLSNIDYVYDRDPNEAKDVPMLRRVVGEREADHHVGPKKITEIDWKNFRKIVGNKWKPGMNAPFDPIASQKGEKLGLEVIIMNGKNLGNLKNYFETGKFKGTKISG